jgi:hypothetical protein
LTGISRVIYPILWTGYTRKMINRECEEDG